MADGAREGQEISRRIREELDRIREAESRVEEALEAVRQARRRVEVVARELGREEERVRGWVREELRAARPAGPSAGPGAVAEPPPAEAPSPDAGTRSWRTEPGLGWSTWREAAARGREGGPVGPGRGAPEGALPEDRRPAAPDVEAWSVERTDSAAPLRSAPPGAPGAGGLAPSPARRPEWWKLGGLGLLAALVVALVGWFAIRGLRRESVASAPVSEPAPSDVVAPAPAMPAAGEAPAESAPPLASLPDDPAARQALYDSLFAARSPLFDPLLATLEAEAGNRDIERALGAWRGNSMDAQFADLIHSALLQHVLRGASDPRIVIDGQVLRNPCRGRSCTALLNVWEQQGDRYRLPPVPAEAATDPRALRQAEAALVLSWIQEANGAAPPAP